MRISSEQKEFICNYWQTKNATNKTYLFGSRVDDSKKGGDIDVLVLSENKLRHTEIFKMKMAFFSKFGAQKLDVVNFENNDESEFKKHILSYAQPLTK